MCKCHKHSSSVQLCAGQISGTETAVHTVTILFQQEHTEAILLVDATNAFNSLNRLVALHNIRHLCPSLAAVLINTYRAPIKLFCGRQRALPERRYNTRRPFGYANVCTYHHTSHKEAAICWCQAGVVCRRRISSWENHETTRVVESSDYNWSPFRLFCQCH